MLSSTFLGDYFSLKLLSIIAGTGQTTFADLLGAVVTAINKDETLKADINAAIKRVSM